MKDDVACRSDWAYAQLPLAFTWQGRRLEVKAILAERRIPDGMTFVVITNDNEHFELIYEQNPDQWTIQPLSAKESA